MKVHVNDYVKHHKLLLTVSGLIIAVLLGLVIRNSIRLFGDSYSSTYNINSNPFELTFNHDMFIDLEESSRLIDDWMVSLTDWFKPVAEVTAISDVPDLQMGLESWMLDAKTWHLNTPSPILYEADRQLQSWMYSEAQWSFINKHSLRELVASPEDAISIKSWMYYPYGWSYLYSETERSLESWMVNLDNW